jgi:hypothetical protein
MMASVSWPRTLPCPQTSTVTPAERRALSSADRPREARNIQRDRLEYERVTWPAMDIPKAGTILTFWRDTLKHGGAWFVADWPLPRGIHTQAVRKFREQPRWQFIAGGFWQLSALCEVRGRGLLIDDQVPPPSPPPEVWSAGDFGTAVAPTGATPNDVADTVLAGGNAAWAGSGFLGVLTHVYVDGIDVLGASSWVSHVGSALSIVIFRSNGVEYTVGGVRDA